jgi:hypothetical protein
VYTFQVQDILADNVVIVQSPTAGFSLQSKRYSANTKETEEAKSNVIIKNFFIIFKLTIKIIFAHKHII